MKTIKRPLYKEGTEDVLLSVNKTRVPVRIEVRNGRAYMHFGYNKALLDLVKESFEGRKYHGYDEKDPKKVWSFPIDSEHNQVTLAYLRGDDPYARYFQPAPSIDVNRTCARDYQRELIDFTCHALHCILAAEMGVGKTFVTIEVSEHLQYPDFWYVAPRSALASARLDYEKWGAKYSPIFMTYEGLVKRVSEWQSGDPVPRMVVFDEASRLKNWTSKRTQAAYHVARAIRAEHGWNSCIILMSGSPSPKSPLDWWSLCQIAHPAWLKEGSPTQFQGRYAILKKEDYGTGAFNRIVAWRDNDRRCVECGKVDSEFDHADSNPDKHYFVSAGNEVAKLYGRMQGLVLVKMKKDCLSLPDKIYRVVQCDVTPEMKRLAKLIKLGSSTTIETLTRLRELSDGFQYKEIEGPPKFCERCYGNRTIIRKDHTEDCLNSGNEAFVAGQSCPCPEGRYDCDVCAGTGMVKTFQREIKELACAKDAALEEILEDCADRQRIVIYAGFTASIDRVQRICEKNKWKVIRVDGRGCRSEYGDLEDSVRAFQDKNNKDDIAFVAHPESAGMGLTLTRSDTTVYFSNDFKAENRIQSEDRIHRLGMDENRGANIIDLVGLPSDLYVLQNLQKKRDLQAISMGELAASNLWEMEVDFR